MHCNNTTPPIHYMIVPGFHLPFMPQQHTNNKRNCGLSFCCTLLILQLFFFFGFCFWFRPRDFFPVHSFYLFEFVSVSSALCISYLFIFANFCAWHLFSFENPNKWTREALSVSRNEKQILTTNNNKQDTQHPIQFNESFREIYDFILFGQFFFSSNCFFCHVEFKNRIASFVWTKYFHI